MTQVEKIQLNKDNELQQGEQNSFEVCEQIVNELVDGNLPNSFNPDTFILKISNTYNITQNEARTCLKLAVKQLENQKETIQKQDELRYAQSGYFYPTRKKDSINQPQKHNDGMDSLSSLGAYNKLMFGIR